MDYFFKISKFLNVFGSGNSKTRFPKKQLNAVYVFKQLIARIAFQMMLPLVGYSTGVYLRQIPFDKLYNHTPCFQTNFFQSLLKICLQYHTPVLCNLRNKCSISIILRLLRNLHSRFLQF